MITYVICVCVYLCNVSFIKLVWQFSACKVEKLVFSPKNLAIIVL